MQSLGWEEGRVQEVYSQGDREGENRSPRSTTAERKLWRRKKKNDQIVVTVPHVVEYPFHLPCGFCALTKAFTNVDVNQKSCTSSVSVKAYNSNQSCSRKKSVVIWADTVPEESEKRY